MKISSIYLLIANKRITQKRKKSYFVFNFVVIATIIIHIGKNFKYLHITFIRLQQESRKIYYYKYNLRFLTLFYSYYLLYTRHT